MAIDLGKTVGPITPYADPTVDPYVDPTGIVKKAGSAIGNNPGVNAVNTQYTTGQADEAPSYQAGKSPTDVKPIEAPVTGSAYATDKTKEFIEGIKGGVGAKNPLSMPGVAPYNPPAAPQYSTVPTVTGATVDTSKIPGAFQIAPTGPVQSLSYIGNSAPSWLQAQAGQIGNIANTDYSKIQMTPEMQAALIQGTQVGNVNPMNAANIGSIDYTNANQSRAFQTALANQLQQQSIGQGPSVAGEQLRQGLSKNLAASQAQMASLRGNQPLGARVAMQSAAQQRSDFNNQMALARLAEQQGAQQQLGNVSQSLRGQDLSTAGMQQQLATSNAGFQQEAGVANMNAAQQRTLAQAQMDSAMRQRQAELIQAANQQNNQVAAQRNISQADLNQNVNLANTASAQQRAITQAQLNQQAGLSNSDRQLQFANQEAGRQLQVRQMDLQRQVAQGNLSAQQADLLFKGMAQNAQFQQQANLANQSTVQAGNQQQLQQYGINTDAALRQYLANQQAAIAARQVQGQQLNAAAGILGGVASYFGGPTVGETVAQQSNQYMNNQNTNPNSTTTLDQNGNPVYSTPNMPASDKVT